MSTSGQGVNSAWNERMRLIRLRRKKERPRFREELRIIPGWLKVFCFVLYLIAIAIGVAVVNLDPEARFPNLPSNAAANTLAIIGIVTGVSLVFTTLVMMLGYVYRDAKRRDMNPVLWTLLVAVLTPSSILIGFVIYLLVRDPLPYPCPRCSAPVGPRFNFCPNCKNDLHPSCPNCKREIVETDKFCPYCAFELKPPQLTESQGPPPAQNEASPGF